MEKDSVYLLFIFTLSSLIIIALGLLTPVTTIYLLQKIFSFELLNLSNRTLSQIRTISAITLTLGIFLTFINLREVNKIMNNKQGYILSLYGYGLLSWTPGLIGFFLYIKFDEFENFVILMLSLVFILIGYILIIVGKFRLSRIVEEYEKANILQNDKSEELKSFKQKKIISLCSYLLTVLLFLYYWVVYQYSSSEIIFSIATLAIGILDLMIIFFYLFIILLVENKLNVIFIRSSIIFVMYAIFNLIVNLLSIGEFIGFELIFILTPIVFFFLIYAFLSLLYSEPDAVFYG